MFKWNRQPTRERALKDYFAQPDELRAYEEALEASRMRRASDIETPIVETFGFHAVAWPVAAIIFVASLMQVLP